MGRWGSFFLSAASGLCRKLARKSSGSIEDAGQRAVDHLRSAARRCTANGNEEAARHHLEEILAIQTQRLGITDCRTLAARVDLANHLQASHDYKGAQSHYDKALYSLRQTAGEFHPNVLVLKFTQAQSFLRQGDLQSAKTLLLHICCSSRKIAGANDPATLLYLDCLASTLLRLGSKAAAATVISELLEFRMSSTDPSEYSTTLATASVLVTNFLNAAEWHQALPIQERILMLLRHRRGEKEVETLLASSLYGIMLVECGQLTGARALLHKISGEFIDTLGPGHSQTLTVCFLLGAVMARQGDDLAARAILEGSYFAAQKMALRDSTAFIRLGTELGTVLLKLQDYGAAQALLSELLFICESLSAEDSPGTLANLNNLAVACWGLGNLDQGLRIQEELVRRKRRRYGNEHAATFESMTTLAFMHARFDRQRKRSQFSAGHSETRMNEFSGSTFETSTCIVIEGIEIVTRLRGFSMPVCKQ